MCGSSIYTVENAKIIEDNNDENEFILQCKILGQERLFHIIRGGTHKYNIVSEDMQQFPKAEDRLKVNASINMFLRNKHI